MKCPFRLVGLLAGIICLWILPSHAITLHVSDDQTVRIDQSTSSPSHQRQSKWKSRLGNFYSKVTQNTTISIHNHRHGYEEQGFLKFDLSPIPLDGEIRRATLRLWLNKIQKSGILRFHEVLANWDEDTIQANQFPPTGPVFESLEIEKNDNNQFMTIDVTTLVRGWLNNPDTNFGLALVSDQADPLQIKLDSKENTYTSHPMEIEVTLEPGEGKEGAQGIQGPLGPPGQIGPTGPPGSDGSDGSPGAPGQNGATWLTGNVIPTYDQGVVGDFYLENDTGQYFTKTDSTTWTLLGSLRGPQGNDGQTGPQGNSGPQGLQGIPGPTGAQGAQGVSGPTGLPGPQGLPGSTPLLFMVGQNCPAGEFLTGFDAVGNILCGTPPASSFPSPPATNDVNPGDVIITEIMIDPSVGGLVSDANGEWFELFNTRSETVDIRGWRIEDKSGKPHIIPDTEPILISPNGYFVLGKNADSSTNGGISVGHQYTEFLLNNGGDTLFVFDVNDEEIDRVDYGTASFTVPTGASLNLNPDSFDLNDNDDGANWCAGTTSIGIGLDFGTPGAANETC